MEAGMEGFDFEQKDRIMTHSCWVVAINGQLDRRRTRSEGSVDKDKLLSSSGNDKRECSVSVQSNDVGDSAIDDIGVDEAPIW